MRITPLGASAGTVKSKVLVMVFPGDSLGSNSTLMRTVSPALILLRSAKMPLMRAVLRTGKTSKVICKL